MKSTSASKYLPRLHWIIGIAALAYLSTPVLFAAQQSAATRPPAAIACASAKKCDAPRQAVDALVDAAQRFDEVALVQIFGPNGEDVVLSAEGTRSPQGSSECGDEAGEKKSVSVDP